jgi:hypothetical protein
MRRWRLDFTQSNSSSNESWYDLIEDWELIEASFTQQYGIRLAIDDLSWYEFQTKLQLLNEKTPLGYVVSIRAENDPEVLKNFNKDQHKIRNEYRRKAAANMSKEEYYNAMQGFKAMFKSMATKK